ncbi:MAG: hypothetical protein RR323_06460, partial [Raoultibacter sp.]
MLGKKLLGHVASLVFAFVLVVGLIPVFTSPAYAAGGAGSAGAGAPAGVITPDASDDLEVTTTPVSPDGSLDGELPFANTSLLAAAGALASVSINGEASTAYATLPEIVAVINAALATDSLTVSFLRNCPDVDTTAAISTKAQVVMKSDPAAMAANANTPFVITRLVTS